MTPGVEFGAWVPVAERLPEEGQAVVRYRKLEEKLLAAQHRIKVLCEALETCRTMADHNNDGISYEASNKALSTPDDTAEIDAVMKDAEKWRDYQKRVTDIAKTGTGRFPQRKKQNERRIRMQGVR